MTTWKRFKLYTVTIYTKHVLYFACNNGHSECIWKLLFSNVYTRVYIIYIVAKIYVQKTKEEQTEMVCHWESCHSTLSILENGGFDMFRNKVHVAR